MTVSFATALEEVIVEVLESQAFLFAEVYPTQELEKPMEGGLQAQVAFEGPDTGKLQLSFSVPLTRELAANVLGVEAEDILEEAEMEDGLKELLNVVCSHCLTTVYGQEEEIQLSIPTVKPLGADDWRILLERRDVVGFAVDDEPILAHWDLETEEKTEVEERHQAAPTDPNGGQEASRDDRQERDERTPIDGAIECVGNFDVLQAKGIDLSESGICFKVDGPMLFDMRFKVEEQDHAYRAQLVWVKQDDDAQYRLGFKFVGEAPGPIF